MKPTPKEVAALAYAKTITPLPMEQAAVLSRRRDIHEFPLRHEYAALQATRLVWAAERWEARRLKLDLYWHAMRKGDTAEAAYHRVTQLSTPTATIRRDLTDAHADALRTAARAYELIPRW